MRTAKYPDVRRIEKIRLIKSLYSRWGAEEVRKLVRLIDWFIKLPKNLELRVREEIHVFEQEKQMPYVTSFEQLAMEEGEARGEARGEAHGEARAKAEGLRNGIALGLKLRFGGVGVQLMPEIRQIEDPVLLQRVFDSIESASSTDEIRHLWTP